MATKYAPGRESIPGRTVKLDDVEIYCEEMGAGEPLVLLHGYGGCAQNWHPFAAELAMHHRLIIVDMRGHGYSTNSETRFTHREAAKDVFLVLDALKIGSFSAMGISSGAMVLLHMATSQPKRIDSMVLVSATTHFPDQARNIMRRASINTMPAAVQDMYRECAKLGDDQIARLISDFNALAEDDEDMKFTLQALSAITARTLIVHGDRDNFFPVEIPLGLYHSIPHAELWIVPGGDHAPIFDPVVPFTATALRFLGGPG